MKFEQLINYQLNKMPRVKKVIKRIYQKLMYLLSKKEKVIGNVIKITPDDDYEYFFGYYDKSPWSADEKYMLCLRAKCTWKDVSPKEPAEIILIDTSNNNSIKILGTTSTWNVQQGCMLQWLGPNYNKEIIYNDYINNKYCSVILNIESMEKKIINFPVYSVASDGSFALSLDFSRLYNLRPGYGYYNAKEKTEGVSLPNETCIWKINLKTGKISELLKYTDFANFNPRQEMKMENAVHKVNHIMISPNGKRFMVLYRWFNGQRKYTRLITCDTDGKNMYLLSDDDMVSHCCWKNDNEILAFENKHKYGTGYYLMKDKTQEFKKYWKDISNDGHPSYSPNGKYVVIDSYPNRIRMQSLKIMTDSANYKEIAQVFSPFKYDNDTRCDLHPRWDRKSKKICFDSVFEGKRGLYIVNINNRNNSIVFDNNVQIIDGLVSCIIPTYKRNDMLNRAIDSVLNQTYKNIEILVIDDNVPGDQYSKKVEENLKKYKDNKNVKLIRQKIHKNGAVARNVGIKYAKGEFIAFLDDDDEWDSQKIEKQIKKFTNEKIGVVTCLWKTYKNNLEQRKCNKYNEDNIQFKIFSRQVSIYTSTVIIRKKIVIEFGGFDESLLRHQDLQFLIDASELTNFYVLPEYLVKLHTDSDINRPNLEKLIEYKKKFFNSEKMKLEKFNTKEKKRIINAHYYEIVNMALKEKKIAIALKYCLKAGVHYSSIKDLYTRMKNRKVE